MTLLILSTVDTDNKFTKAAPFIDKTIRGARQVKFVNTRVLLGLFMRNRLRGLFTPARHTCQAYEGDIFSPS